MSNMNNFNADYQPRALNEPKGQRPDQFIQLANFVQLSTSGLSQADKPLQIATQKPVPARIC